MILLAKFDGINHIFKLTELEYRHYQRMIKIFKSNVKNDIIKHKLKIFIKAHTICDDSNNSFEVINNGVYFL